MDDSGVDAGGAGTPDWIDPTASGAAPPVPVDVNLKDLATFAKDVITARGVLVSNWQDGIQPLLAHTGASFGFAGTAFPETYRLRQQYALAQQAAAQFYADAIQGLTAIAWAAETIATEYEDGDLAGKEGLDAVSDSFSPQDRSRSLLTQQQEAAEPAADGDDTPPPSDRDVPWYLNHTQDPAGDPSRTDGTSDPSTVEHPPNEDTTLSEGKPGEYTIPDDPYDHTPSLTGKVP